jgi:transcriptional regulator of heat shock response
MNERQSKLLAAVIEQFITTALPVGSQHIFNSGKFHISGATVRNEMRLLGEEGFLQQPHISAGRIPTAKGYRMYIQNNIEPNIHEKSIRKKFDDLREQYFQRKDQERLYEAVALLSHMMPNIAFATVPHKHRLYYLGLAETLRQPDFMNDPSLVSGVAEVLEDHLANVVDSLEIDDTIRYYIGEDHILPQLQSCSMIITEYRIRDQHGAIGILGPMRMDYGYNHTALDMVASLIRE